MCFELPWHQTSVLLSHDISWSECVEESVMQHAALLSQRLIVRETSGVDGVESTIKGATPPARQVDTASHYRPVSGDT